MTVKPVFHPSMILALNEAHNQIEIGEATLPILNWITSDWIKNQNNGFHLSEGTFWWLNDFIGSYDINAIYTFLNRLPSRITQKPQETQVVRFISHILQSKNYIDQEIDAGGCMRQFNADSVSPSFIPERYGPARKAEKNDVYLLANTPEDEDTNWVIIVHPQLRKRFDQAERYKAFEVQEPPVPVESSPGKQTKKQIIACKKVPIACQPDDIDSYMDGEELLAADAEKVRRQVSGKQALFIGGDRSHWNRQEEAIKSLGFADVKFYECHRGHEEIKPARRALQTGEYSFFCYFYDYSPHIPKEFTKNPPDGCSVIMVRSVTRRSVAQAIIEQYKPQTMERNKPGN